MTTATRRRGQKLLSVATGCALLFGVSVFSAQSAAAVAPTCNTKFTSAEVHAGGPLDAPGYINGALKTTSCNLTKGNSNITVGSLQRALNACYGYRLATDGIFGNATVNALKAAQRAEGLSADGVYGPQTAAKLKFAAVNVNSCGGRQRTF